MPFIDLKRFGEWCEKEAAPFIGATVSTTLSTGNPYVGLASGLTTTNGRGGNPLGKVGKDLEPAVTVATAITIAARLLRWCLLHWCLLRCYLW